MEGTMVDESAVRKLRASLRGELLFPADESYDAARKVFNAMIDKRPAAIARCAGAADVIACVRFAREHEVLVSVRGGGHNVAGKAACDNGLMIDLSRMKGIRVDPARRIAQAQPGLTLGEFDRETQAFGLATTLGIISMTGIAGLTLGGGLGWLMGKYGLACDNVLAADVVTADGQLTKASATENPDLYWGIRGGGGNFGIVTCFEYRLHPVGPLLAGMVIHPLDSAREVLRFYDEFAASCPDELSLAAALLNGPDGNSVVALAGCYCGPLDQGEKALKPLRSFRPPAADLFRAMQYVEVQQMLNDAFPAQQHHYWKSNFIRRLSQQGIEILVERARTKPSPLTVIVLQQMHGAASAVPATETAFHHRQVQHDFMFLSVWSDLADSDTNIRWTRESYEAMQPFLERTVYVNNLGEEGEDRVRAAYGPNYDRLVALKNKYDPANFFRLNQNIRPTVGETAVGRY